MADPRQMAAKQMLQGSGAGVMDVKQEGMTEEFKVAIGMLAKIAQQALGGDPKSQMVIIELGKALPQIAETVNGGVGQGAVEGEMPQEQGGITA